MHSCGYINSAPLIKLAKFLDFANIDLKGFSSKFYASMGSGKLKPVLNAIKILKKEGVWIEITNLIIPTVNDSDEELKELATWVRDNLGLTTPLHFSRFFPHHRLTQLPPTSEKTLYKAAKIAKNIGLKYVYIGNLWGNPYEDTYCHKCNKLIIDRKGYEIIKMNLEIKKGRAYCAYCKTLIPGIFFLQNKKE
jgi:pyruvate formate lyase activating enzyme